MKTLDLHGKRHHEIERLVENFVLTETLPVKIITGNSLTMRTIVQEVLDSYDLVGEYESDWNLGALIVTDTS